MKQKIKVAVFDKDQRIRKIEKCEISRDGSKIRIKKGGKGHWYPEFDNTSYLEFPKPWYIGGGSEKVYFVRNFASKCINFKTEVVPDVDLEEIEKAARNDILKGIGTEEDNIPLITYIIGILSFLTFLMLLARVI